MSDEAWCQAQLGLNSGGLGLRSLSLHSSSAFIASFCSSGVYDTDDIHLTNALDHFNSTVAPIEKLSVNSVVSSPVSHSGMLRLATPMYLCYNVYDTFSTYV